jgi:putative peptidoglycan lipid II flippase
VPPQSHESLTPAAGVLRGPHHGLILSAGTAASIVISIISQWYLLAIVGVGVESDSFYAASALPLFVNGVLCDPLAFVLVPILSKSHPDRFWTDSWTVICGTVIVFGAAFAAIYLVTPWLLPILLPGFQLDGLALVERMSTILVLAMFLGAIGSSVRAVLHATDSYIWPVVCSVLGAAAGLAFLVWALPQMGTVAAAFATVARMGVETTLMFKGVERFERPRFNTALARNIAQSTWPLWLANTYYRSDILLDRALSSMAHAGGLSILALAQQVFGATSQVLNRGASAPLLPRLSRLASERNWTGFTTAYTTYSRRLFLFVGLCLVVLLGAGWIVSGASFQLAGVTSSDVAQLWLMVILLSGLALGDPIAFIYSSAFYALGDTRTPSQVSAAAFTLSILLKIFGFLLAGIYGVAVAISLFNALRSWVLARALRGRLAENLLAVSPSH